MYNNEQSLNERIKNHPKWFRLDNAAKIYPVVSGPHNGHVFRVSMDLKEEVNPSILQNAINDLKSRFPAFYVRMREGFFWYYYETNDKVPEVRNEPPYMCKPFDFHSNNGHHFSCFYYKNRISLEVFHSICDGTGAMEFLKAIVYRYLELLGHKLESENLLLTCDEPPSPEESEDSYIKSYDDKPVKRPGADKAYRITGTPFLQGGTGIIAGKMPVVEVKKLAKEKSVTITQYLAALLAYSIVKTGNEKRLAKSPVNIFIPVNLRRYYNSKTLRNFSLYFYSPIRYKGKPLSFDKILEETKKNFESELNLDKLQNTLNANVSVEKNKFVRGCPLFVKKILLRIGYNILGKTLTTSTITNLGNIKLPKSMQPLIDDIELNLGSGYNTGSNAAVSSYNGTMTVSFARGIKETHLEKTFFKFLSDKGVKVTLTSNLWENFS